MASAMPQSAPKHTGFSPSALFPQGLKLEFVELRVGATEVALDTRRLGLPIRSYLDRSRQ
jgi:hypothetical protein